MSVHPVEGSFQFQRVWRLWTLALVLSVLGVAALAVDVPIATWVHEGYVPRALQKLCGLSEAMGHGIGVAMIALLIAVLDPPSRYRLPRIMTAALGAGLAANVLKLVVARTRPNHFEWEGTGVDSFGQWFPLSANPSWNQGFPSSHAATAAGLAIVLAVVYPRGRVVFVCIAVLAGMQRVLEEAHFSSDVLWGAAVGCLVAPLCVYTGKLAHAFDRLEAWLSDGVAQASTLHGPAATCDTPARSSRAA
jgi:membrane-associated phospholipid phosphatase